MSEKRLLNCILIEGIMLIILSLCLLILPKLTSLSFGVMLSAVLISYGLYKIINIFISRNFTLNSIFSLLIGIFAATIGILLLFVPKISLLWLIALIGVYFLLESISSISFAIKMKEVYHYSSFKLFSAILLFIIGLIIILGVPVMSFWIVTVLSGIAFLIKGMAKFTIALSNFNNYHI